MAARLALGDPETPTNISIHASSATSSFKRADFHGRSNVNHILVFFVPRYMRNILGLLVIRVAELLDRSLITVPELDESAC